MKLPDFLEFEPFRQLKDQMGIPREAVGEIFGPKLSAREQRQLRGPGIEITIDNVGVLEDRTLVYKDRRIILYIRDINQTVRYDDPKFHVSDCDAVRSMRENRRFERFVVADRSDGEFELRYVGSGRFRKVEKRLAVCKYCLHTLRYKGYDSSMARADKDRAVTSFSIEEFFSKYPRSFHTEVPSHTSRTAPVNDYPPDWDMIARQFKERARWSCEKCRVDLSRKNFRKYLHVHHENGQKYDNRPENLKVLCIRCHAQQHLHDHLKKHPDYREFIRLSLF